MNTTQAIQNLASAESIDHITNATLPVHEERLELSQLLALQNGVPFLRRLTLEQLVKLWPYFGKKTYPAGSILRDEGDPIDFIALIVRGQLRIEKSGGCKRTRFLLAELNAGSWELSMMAGNESGVIVTATEPSEILTLRRNDLEYLLDVHPRLGVAALREMTKVLGIRLRKSSERLLDVL